MAACRHSWPRRGITSTDCAPQLATAVFHFILAPTVHGMETKHTYLSKTISLTLVEEKEDNSRGTTEGSLVAIRVRTISQTRCKPNEKAATPRRPLLETAGTGKPSKKASGDSDVFIAVF